MKLMQLNVWTGRLQKQINNLVAAEQPDILCLQEVVDIDGGAVGFCGTLDELLEQVSDYRVFFAPVIGFPLFHRSARFGNAIISRYPIGDKQTVFTHKEYIPDFDIQRDTYNVRNFQHATVDTPGGPLHVINHHGFHVHEHKEGTDETLRQTGMIADYIAGLSGKIILAGDFNLAPESDSIDQINAHLRNLSVEAKLSTTRTELTPKAEVCDYIFVSKDIQTKRFYASESAVSDHQALFLEFE